MQPTYQMGGSSIVLILVIFCVFMNFLLLNTVKMHIKCRGGLYPQSNVTRLLLSDDKVPWTMPVPDYQPPCYDSPVLHNKPWADPDLGTLGFHPKWNHIDGGVDRKSHSGDYQVLEGQPLNPGGRTGLKGRGLLGRWGPNHAADPIVTRWKADSVKHPRILQFCAIQRRDNNQWAIPGGMVDPGEKITQTLKREFLEEATNSLEEDDAQNSTTIEELFRSGTEVYKGYVDDPRNTDNAWMETVAVNYHDDSGEILGKLHLKAGDDARNVQWMDISQELDLYASHKDFLKLVAEIRGAHW